MSGAFVLWEENELAQPGEEEALRLSSIYKESGHWGVMVE